MADPYACLLRLIAMKGLGLKNIFPESEIYVESM